jgi:hypothetical protein
VHRFGHESAERLNRRRQFPRPACGGAKDRLTSGIIQCDPQVKPLSICCRAFHAANLLAQRADLEIGVNLHSYQPPHWDRQAELLSDAFQPPLRGGPTELLGESPKPTVERVVRLK